MTTNFYFAKNYWSRRTAQLTVMDKRKRVDAEEGVSLTKSQKRRKKEFRVGQHVFRTLAPLVPVLLADSAISDDDLAIKLTGDRVREAIVKDLKEKDVKTVIKRVYHGTHKEDVKRMFDYLKDIRCPKKAAQCHGLVDEDNNALINAWQGLVVSKRYGCPRVPNRSSRKDKGSNQI